LERGFHAEAYVALVVDLEEAGFEAELRAPEEQRFGLPQELVNAALTLSEKVGDETIAVIVGIYVDRMLRSRRRRKDPPSRPPVMELYGPDGDVLRTVEIPERDEDATGEGS
jgi:hypothetical protein